MDLLKVKLDGEVYIKYNNKWVDSSFIVVPANTARKLIENEYSKVDYDKASLEQLKQIVVEAREAEFITLMHKAAESIIRQSLAANDQATAGAYIPVITSCLRKEGNSLGAIEYCSTMKANHGSRVLSVSALTSLAAAYCDVEDWQSAKIAAKQAYAKQGGGVGYANELSLVFKRIEIADKAT